MKNKRKIVIVGGGFGGIYTLKTLKTIFEPNEIEITLMDIQGCDAKIGIDAPKEVTISYEGMPDYNAPSY